MKDKLKKLEERIEALEKVVFAPMVTACKNCGGLIQEFAPYDVGPRCPSCGGKEFKMVKLYETNLKNKLKEGK